ERPELPVVPPPHRVVDRADRVGDLAALAPPGRDAARGVCEAAVEDLAREVTGLALVGDQLADALARIFDLGDGLRRRPDRLVAALRPVVERLRVAGEDRLGRRALVEAGLRLVAEELPVDHRA